MPLYEYKCENCGEIFEAMQKFSDEPLTIHEKCGGKVHRLLSAPALQFKGSGWYVTDYARGGGSAAKSESSGDNGEAKKSDASAAASPSDSSTATSAPSSSDTSKT